MKRAALMSDLGFGVDTFGDVPEDGFGNLLSPAAAIRQVVDAAMPATTWADRPDDER